MLELTQEVIDEQFGTCYGTALACILEFPLPAIPQVPRDDEIVRANHRKNHRDCSDSCKFEIRTARDEFWHDMWRAFKAEHNITTVRIDTTKLGKYDRHAFPNTLHILSGLSPRDRDLKGNDGRGRTHSVVGKGGRIYWDPHPDRTGLLTIDDIEFVMPTDPSKPMCAALR